MSFGECTKTTWQVNFASIPGQEMVFARAASTVLPNGATTCLSSSISGGGVHPLAGPPRQTGRGAEASAGTPLRDTHGAHTLAAPSGAARIPNTKTKTP